MKSKAQDINKYHRKVFIFYFLGVENYTYIYIEIKDIIKKKFKSTYLIFFFFFLGVTILWFNGI